jgi:hypothetical protein
MQFDWLNFNALWCNDWLSFKELKAQMCRDWRFSPVNQGISTLLKTV